MCRIGILAANAHGDERFVHRGIGGDPRKYVPACVRDDRVDEEARAARNRRRLIADLSPSQQKLERKKEKDARKALRESLRDRAEQRKALYQFRMSNSSR